MTADTLACLVMTAAAVLYLAANWWRCRVKVDTTFEVHDAGQVAELQRRMIAWNSAADELRYLNPLWKEELLAAAERLNKRRARAYWCARCRKEK